MDWSKCIIFGDDGNLKCPADGAGLSTYETFSDNAERFQSLSTLPAKLCFDDTRADELLENKAKWHKACYIKFATSKLERMKIRMENKRKCTEG